MTSGKNGVHSKRNEAGTRKEWKNTIEPNYNKFYFVLNCHKTKLPHSLDTHPRSSIGCFLWHFEYDCFSLHRGDWKLKFLSNHF